MQENTVPNDGWQPYFRLKDGTMFPLLALRAPMKKPRASLPLCLQARSASFEVALFQAAKYRLLGAMQRQ